MSRESNHRFAAFQGDELGNMEKGAIRRMRMANPGLIGIQMPEGIHGDTNKIVKRRADEV